MPKRIDITGRKYNRLTAIKQVGMTKNKLEELWLFQCECGNTTIAQKNQVTSGHIKSCGCLRKELGRSNIMKFNQSEKSKEAGRKHAAIYNPYGGQKQREKQLKGIKRADNTSGITGVSQDKNGRWRAYITYRRKRYSTSCITKQDAINWRKAMEAELDIYSPEGIKA